MGNPSVLMPFPGHSLKDDFLMTMNQVEQVLLELTRLQSRAQTVSFDFGQATSQRINRAIQYLSRVQDNGQLQN
jgi:hypothetical protein